MPSSGYKSVSIINTDNPKEHYKCAQTILHRAKIAMNHGLFIEWLESFLGAWEETNDPWIASMAGLDEWDM